MADESLELLIKTTADTSGADKVAGATEELTKGTQKSAAAHEEAGKAAEKHGEHHRELHRLMHKVTEESPALGLAMRAYFATPVGAAIMAVVMALEHFMKVQEQAKEKAKEAAGELAKKYTDAIDASARLGEQAQEAERKVVEEFKALASAQDQAKTKTEAVTSAIEAEKTAVSQLMKAREEYELSQTSDEHARGAIRDRYKDKNRDLEEAAKVQTLKAKQDAVNAAVTQSAALRKEMDEAVAKDTGNALGWKNPRIDLLLRQQDEERLKKQIGEATQAMGKYEGKDEKKYEKAARDLQIASNALQDTERIMLKDKGAIAELHADAEAKTKAYMDNSKFIEETNAQLPRQRLETSAAVAEAAYGRATDSQSRFSQAGADLTSAAAQMDVGGLALAASRLAQLAPNVKELKEAILRASAEVEQSLQELKADAARRARGQAYP